MRLIPIVAIQISGLIAVVATAQETDTKAQSASLDPLQAAAREIKTAADKTSADSNTKPAIPIVPKVKVVGNTDGSANFATSLDWKLPLSHTEAFTAGITGNATTSNGLADLVSGSDGTVTGPTSWSFGVKFGYTMTNNFINDQISGAIKTAFKNETIANYFKRLHQEGMTKAVETCDNISKGSILKDNKVSVPEFLPISKLCPEGKKVYDETFAEKNESVTPAITSQILVQWYNAALRFPALDVSLNATAGESLFKYFAPTSDSTSYTSTSNTYRNLGLAGKLNSVPGANIWERRRGSQKPLRKNGAGALRGTRV